MNSRRIMLAALAALSAGPMLVVPAAAQSYRDDYGYDRPRRPPPPDYGCPPSALLGQIEGLHERRMAGSS